jgi:hypothetical protein
MSPEYKKQIMNLINSAAWAHTNANNTCFDRDERNGYADEYIEHMDEIEKLLNYDTLGYQIARAQALGVASEYGLRQISGIHEYWDGKTCSFSIFGKMFDQDPDIYPEGIADRLVRVTDGKIDLVDGV